MNKKPKEENFQKEFLQEFPEEKRCRKFLNKPEGFLQKISQRISGEILENKYLKVKFQFLNILHEKFLKKSPESFPK